MKARTEGEVATKLLGDLSPFSPFARISFKAIVGRMRLLICFRHLVYHFFAYLSNKTTFVPTVEVVKEQQFLIFLPYGTGNVVVHNVGYEILRHIVNDLDYFFGVVAFRHGRSCRVRNCYEMTSVVVYFTLLIWHNFYLLSLRKCKGIFY